MQAAHHQGAVESGSNAVGGGAGAGEEQRSSNHSHADGNAHSSSASSSTTGGGNWAENRLSDVVRTGKGKARKDAAAAAAAQNRHNQQQHVPQQQQQYQQQQQRNLAISPTPAMVVMEETAATGTRPLGNNTKNFTKQSSSNNPIHVIKCVTPNINASNKLSNNNNNNNNVTTTTIAGGAAAAAGDASSAVGGGGGAAATAQQLDKSNKTEDEMHPMHGGGGKQQQQQQQRLVEGYGQQGSNDYVRGGGGGGSIGGGVSSGVPTAGHMPSSGAGACSVANTTLTTGMNDLSLNQNQHKKPALVGVQHMKKELNNAGKDAGKHKSVVATSPSAPAAGTINLVSTDNIGGSTASKLSYAQVAQHHKTASESKDGGNVGGGTMSPTSSHKLELVFGDQGAASSSTGGDNKALTSTTDKRLSASSNASGKGAQTMNSSNTSQTGGAAAAGKDKGKGKYRVYIIL